MDQNGSIIAVGLDNGSVSCYDGLTGEQMWQKQGAAASNINVLAMSEYGNILVSYSRVDFNLTVWDTTNGDVLWTAVMELPYNGIDINQDGTKILLPSWSIDHTSNKIRLYSNDSTAILWETEINAETYSAKISNDGKFVVLGDLSGVVSVLDGNNGSILLEHNTFADNIKEVEISNDGTKFAIRTNEGTITIYDIDVDLGKGSGIAEFFNVLGVYH